MTGSQINNFYLPAVKSLYRYIYIAHFRAINGSFMCIDEQ